MDTPVHPAAKTLPGPKAKRKLTDRTLKALKPAVRGEGGTMMRGQVVPGFGVRVAETGLQDVHLGARCPGSPAYTRRSLGLYGALSLENARAKARVWLELIDKGIDPPAEEERQKIRRSARLPIPSA